mgnify:CR=1 FL=1
MHRSTILCAFRYVTCLITYMIFEYCIPLSCLQVEMVDICRTAHLLTEFSWYCALCNTCRPTSAVCLHTHNMGRVKISVHFGLVSASGIYQSKYDDLMCHHQVFKFFMKLLFSQSIFIVHHSDKRHFTQPSQKTFDK